MIKRIAILTPFHNNFGGGEVYLDKLNNFINKNYTEISTDIYTSDQSVFESSVKQIPIISTYKSFLKNIFKVIKILKKNNVDVVLLNDFYISQFSLIFKVFGFKTFSLLHGEISYLKVENIIIKKIIILIRRFLIELGTEKIFSVNKTNFNYFNKSKIFKVSNFIECSRTENMIKEEKEFDFMFCGRLTEVKNVLQTAEIFKKYMDNYNKNSKFVIIGDGEEREKLEEFISKHKLEQNILIKGFLNRKEIQEYYKKSKAFLLFSKSEGLPTVLLEALSFGIPCITTNVGSISDIIQNDFNGFLININDINLVLDRMNNVVSNYSHYYKNCFKAAQNYDIKYVLSNFVKLLL